MSDVTKILSKLESGEKQASADLLPIVYEELRKLAAVRMARESADHTLQATALVHEAYIRLVGEQSPSWNGRGHFFGAAAEAMRRIMIEHARGKHSFKRGGGANQQELVESQIPDEFGSNLVELDDSLTKLSETDENAAKLVELHVFGGQTIPEAAKCIGMSERTAARRWAFARAWLIREMKNR